jgi:nitrate/nitrite transporter NarK
MSSLPPIGGIVGMLLGGRLTDWMRWKWGLRWGRAIPMGVTRFGAAAAYLCCLFANDPWVTTLACVVVSFFCDLGVAATWAFMQDAGGRYVGVVLGFGNMWGNFGATVAPQIYNYTLKWTNDDWRVVFCMCATTMILSGIAGIFIDATQPIVEDEPIA